MRDSPLETFRFLADSDDSVTVLTAVATESSATGDALQSETDIPRATVDRILADLDRRELVSRDGSRYDVTPIGAFLVDRLRSLSDSIAVVERLQRLAPVPSRDDPRSDFSNPATTEVLAPTAMDPNAPTRRLSDLIDAASGVRLLVPSFGRGLFETNQCGITPSGHTFEAVITDSLVETVTSVSTSSQGPRSLLLSANATVYVYEGDIQVLAGTADETAFVGLVDDEGALRGHIETDDEVLRSWIGRAHETHKREAVLLGADLLSGEE